MAKISARGASKIAQHSITYRDHDGYDHKIRLALRSDGKVLRAHDLRSPDRREAWGSRGWNRGGYSIAFNDLSLTAGNFDDYASRYFRAMHGTLRNVTVLDNTTI